MKSGIYQIKNLANNKVYVGSACDLAARKRHHFVFLRKGTHANKRLQNAWNKYGEANFVFESLDEIKNKTLLVEYEQYYMDILKPFYNIRKNAESNLGLSFGKEVRDRVSKNNARYWLGKKQSKEHTEKIRETKTGVSVHSSEHKKKLRERWKGNKLRAKLSERQVEEIRNKYSNKKENGSTQYSLASEFGVSRTCIQAIVNGRNW